MAIMLMLFQPGATQCMTGLDLAAMDRHGEAISILDTVHTGTTHGMAMVIMIPSTPLTLITAGDMDGHIITTAHIIIIMDIIHIITMDITVTTKTNEMFTRA
jgi:hypothetical protein